jgi:hypothetical protein
MRVEMSVVENMRVNMGEEASYPIPKVVSFLFLAAVSLKLD